MMQSVYRYTIAVMLLVSTLSATGQPLTLFSQEQRQAAGKVQTVVMDFMERYFNSLKYQNATTIQTKMADDKVFFRKGSLSNLSQISDTMPLNISLVDTHYEVTWQKNSQPFVTIVFPAQYDLLLGMNQEVAQQKLKETIMATPLSRSSQMVHAKNNIQEDSVYIEKDSVYYTKTAYLELRSFNDALYYNKVCEDYQPVFSTAHPDYSAANLFHGLISGKNYRMFVEQSVYGLKTINYTLSLNQWLNYCAEWGLKVFFAQEEQREDGLLVLVIAQSQELGFNHMLSVVIPDKFVIDKNAVMKVRMTPYIPNHNVKNLFQQESVNRRKIKWQ